MDKLCCILCTSVSPFLCKIFATQKLVHDVRNSIFRSSEVGLVGTWSKFVNYARLVHRWKMLVNSGLLYECYMIHSASTVYEVILRAMV